MEFSHLNLDNDLDIVKTLNTDYYKSCTHPLSKHFLPYGITSLLVSNSKKRKESYTVGLQSLSQALCWSPTEELEQISQQ